MYADYPTSASVHLPLVRALRRVLHHRGPVTLRFAAEELGDDMGRCRFEDNTVVLNPDLDDEELHSTLVHELIHLHRGAVVNDHMATEEAIVRMRAARELVPQAAALAMLDHDWTPDEIRRMAHAYGVDVDVMLDIVQPDFLPTRRMIRIEGGPDGRTAAAAARNPRRSEVLPAPAPRREAVAGQYEIPRPRREDETGFTGRQEQGCGGPRSEGGAT